MNFNLTRKDVTFAIAVALFLVLMSVVGWYLIGSMIYSVTLSAGFAIVVAVLLEFHRRSVIMHKVMLIEYRQSEALLSLLSAMDLIAPLPDFGHWSMAPDLLKTIAEIILRERPKTIVEVGSGASTIVSAYCLKRLGCGRVISLEHHERIAQLNRETVSMHGLDDEVTIVDASLELSITHKLGLLLNKMPGGGYVL